MLCGARRDRQLIDLPLRPFFGDREVNNRPVRIPAPGAAGRKPPRAGVSGRAGRRLVRNLQREFLEERPREGSFTPRERAPVRRRSGPCKHSRPFLQALRTQRRPGRRPPAKPTEPWLVQMLLVAFSRRMCCSRVCSVRHPAALAVAVGGLADERPGILRTNSCRQAMMPRSGPP